MGETVRVSGTVTVQSGAFSSSITSGFAIQDDTAGIYVLDRDENHQFQLGQTVEIIGTRQADHNQLNIAPERIKRLSNYGKTVIPQTIQTGKVDAPEEGYLIQVQGEITRKEPDDPYGYKIFIDDGSGEYQVFIDSSTELINKTDEWHVGDTIEVIGFAGLYGETYELMPRINADIKIHDIRG